MVHYISRCLFISIFLFLQICAHATEGMWLPHLLSSLNEKEMRKMGMKIKASDIYSINKGSLKDAIVQFGGGCTGEVISNQGLVLTNHHCGYGAIQRLSSVANNYLDNGFWAKKQSEELPNEGLSVTFINRIEDITKQVLREVKPGMSEADRQASIDDQLAIIKRDYKIESYQAIVIRPFYEGNQYFLFVTETYTDIRLVGTPPSSIGKFGADTDNWVWPRHTGDFAIFRIYAGKDNKPAAYSSDNVPFKPKKALTISLKGLKENDFTMVFGFPGKTSEYLPSQAVKLTVDVLDSSKVAIRDVALKIMDSYMRQDEHIKIQYASKFASTANGWKKWQGEMQGVRTYGGLEKKAAYETAFLQKLEQNSVLNAQYGGVLDTLNALYTQITPYARATDYFNELVRNVELLSVANKMIGFINSVYDKSETEYATQRTSFLNQMRSFYKDYNKVVDQDVCGAVMDMYFTGLHSSIIGGEAWQLWMETNKDGTKAAEKMYNASQLVSYEQLEAMVEQPVSALLKSIRQDPAVKMILALRAGYIDHVSKPFNSLQDRINILQRSYMQAQMDVFGKEKRFYPDANSTMRVTYGKMNGYSPRDAVQYDHYSYLDGVIEKYIPGDYEFDVPAKLIELYNAKDYGRYGSNGKMPVCFIASNHTTGGNSGSPALNAHGHLVGLNFDRTWEGTMSDINYDAAICRNIMVDIRYILFIVDKFAGAGHLIEEMNIAK